MRPRVPPDPLTLTLTLAMAATLACGGRDVGSITDPATPWPRSILDLGAVEDGVWTPDAEVVVPYEVGYPLWSGGGGKSRFLALPAGEQIDDRGETWRFPPGAVAFKTFLECDRPLETRALRREDGGAWGYAAYLWDAEAVDAQLLPLEAPVAIELDGGGAHTVPARSQCRECHATADSAMLGVGELQLAAAREGDESELERFDSLGLLARGARRHPAAIEAPDPDTAAVLGWFVGNCVHCHNGSGRDGASFDLSPGVALANTVGQPTESSASAAGIRIVPGSPDQSILYLAVSGEHSDPEIRDMPPVGVDRRDEDGIARLRELIEERAP